LDELKEATADIECSIFTKALYFLAPEVFERSFLQEGHILWDVVDVDDGIKDFSRGLSFPLYEMIRSGQEPSLTVSNIGGNS
jgi:hypothetical protein